MGFFKSLAHLFTPIRDAVETVLPLVGNYYYPGSSILTDQLVSKGAQKNLNSPLGQIANIATGLAGAGFGSGTTGIPASAGYTGAANSLGSLFGNPTLGTDIASGISGIGDNISNGISGLYNGSSLQNGVSEISNGLGFNSAPSGLSTDLSSGLQNAAYAPSSAASSAPGTVASGSLAAAGGGAPGGFSSLSPADSVLGNNAGGFLGEGVPSLDTSGLSSFENAPDLGGKAVDIASTVSGAGNNPNALNGAIRSGLSALFTQNPYSGSPQVANTLNASAQQYSPYIQGGTAANKTLSDLYGLNGADAATAAQQNWQNTPGYKFQLEQGQGALQNSAAAHGGLLSGNTGKALVDYGQGLAGTTYQQYLNNLQNQAGQGQGAIGAQAGLQGSAAQLLQQPKQFQANQTNQGIGGLLASLFPSTGYNFA